MFFETGRGGGKALITRRSAGVLLAVSLFFVVINAGATGADAFTLDEAIAYFNTNTTNNYSITIEQVSDASFSTYSKVTTSTVSSSSFSFYRANTVAYSDSTWRTAVSTITYLSSADSGTEVLPLRAIFHLNAADINEVCARSGGQPSDFTAWPPTQIFQEWVVFEYASAILNENYNPSAWVPNTLTGSQLGSILTSWSDSIRADGSGGADVTLPILFTDSLSGVSDATDNSGRPYLAIGNGTDDNALFGIVAIRYKGDTQVVNAPVLVIEGSGGGGGGGGSGSGGSYYYEDKEDCGVGPSLLPLILIPLLAVSHRRQVASAVSSR